MLRFVVSPEITQKPSSRPSTDLIVPSGGMFRRGGMTLAPTLASVIEDVTDTDTLRVRLLDVFNAEHDAVMDATLTVLEHMIRAGEALCAIRETFPTKNGGWLQWLADNVHLSQGTVHLYMRFARNQEQLRTGGAVDVKSARRVLEGVSRTVWYDPSSVEEARRLHGEGWKLKDIAAHLGYQPRTVSRWCNPDEWERRKKQRYQLLQAGRRATQKAQRDAVVKRMGGRTATAYSYVRKALDALQHAAENEGNAEAKRYLQTAMNRLYAAEDEIVRASKIGQERNPTT